MMDTVSKCWGRELRPAVGRSRLRLGLPWAISLASILLPVPSNGTWIQPWPVPVAVSGTLHVPPSFPLCTYTGPYVLGIVSFCGSPLLPWKPLAEWVSLLGHSRGGGLFFNPGWACGGLRGSSSPWPGGPLETLLCSVPS